MPPPSGRIVLFFVSVAFCTSGVALLYRGRPDPEGGAGDVPRRYSMIAPVDMLNDYWDRKASSRPHLPTISG